MLLHAPFQTLPFMTTVHVLASDSNVKTAPLETAASITTDSPQEALHTTETCEPLK
jgi:hypothetical protein